MAGFGLIWLAMAGSCWLSLAAREDGRKGSASFGVPEPGPMAARLLGSAGLDQSQGWSYCRGRNGSAPLAADVSFRVGGSRDGPCLANNYWPWRSGARPRVVWFSQSRLHPPEEKACPPGASSSSCPSRAWCRPAAAVQHPPARQVCRSARSATGAPGPVLVPVLVLQGGASSSCPGQGLPGLPPGRQRRAGLVGRRHRRPTRSQIEVGPWPSHPGDELEPAHPGGVQASQMVPSRQ